MGDSVGPELGPRGGTLSSGLLARDDPTCASQGTDGCSKARHWVSVHQFPTIVKPAADARRKNGRRSNG